MESEHNTLKLVGACVLPNIPSLWNGYLTRQNLKPWYESLVKPSWRPPNAAFAPVWTGLYTSMGCASYLVYRAGGGFNETTQLPFILYGTQLALNFIWTPLFFVKHDLLMSLVDILGLTATASACAFSFYQVDRTAGYLMIPYLIWLGFATALNFNIYKNNQKNKDE